MSWDLLRRVLVHTHRQTHTQTDTDNTARLLALTSTPICFSACSYASPVTSFSFRRYDPTPDIVGSVG